MERLESADLFLINTADQHGNHYCGAFEGENACIVHIVGSPGQTSLCQMEFPNLEDKYLYKYLTAFNEKELTKNFRPIRNKALGELVRELTLEINKV